MFDKSFPHLVHSYGFMSILILVSMAMQVEQGLEVLYTISAFNWFHANKDSREHGYAGQTSWRNTLHI